MQVCEKNVKVKESCGTWSWNRTTQQFEATWQDGTHSILQVEKMSGGEIVLLRRDPSSV